MNMREIMDILNEAAIEYASYGYYVTADGRFIPIQRGGSHDDAAEEAGLGGKDGAFYAGWIRVVHSPGDWIVAQYDGRHVTKRALQGLASLVRAGKYENPDREPMAVHDSGTGEEFKPVTSAQLMRVIRGLIARHP